MADNTFIRTIHDLSQAVWFGGAAMGAVALRPAAEALADESERVQVIGRGWDAWQPVSTAAMATHLVAGLGMTLANKGRLAGQRGALGVTLTKTGLTFAAVGADLYARRLGAEVDEKQPAPAGGSNEVAEPEPAELSTLKRRLQAAQWAVVGLTGAVIALGAKMGEQQRPSNLLDGITDRFRPGA